MLRFIASTLTAIAFFGCTAPNTAKTKTANSISSSSNSLKINDKPGKLFDKLEAAFTNNVGMLEILPPKDYELDPESIKERTYILRFYVISKNGNPLSPGFKTDEVMLSSLEVIEMGVWPPKNYRFSNVSKSADGYTLKFSQTDKGKIVGSLKGKIAGKIVVFGGKSEGQTDVEDIDVDYSFEVPVKSNSQALTTGGSPSPSGPILIGSPLVATEPPSNTVGMSPRPSPSPSPKASLIPGGGN